VVIGGIPLERERERESMKTIGPTPTHFFLDGNIAQFFQILNFYRRISVNIKFYFELSLKKKKINLIWKKISFLFSTRA
jgi:hypothetical protein